MVVLAHLVYESVISLFEPLNLCLMLPRRALRAPEFPDDSICLSTSFYYELCSFPQFAY